MRENFFRRIKHKKIDRYKLFISILFGVLGLLGAFIPIHLNYNGHEVIFNWSLTFPLLIALAWGRGYGIISMMLGLAILNPIYSSKSYGWVSLLPAVNYLLWIFIIGSVEAIQIQEIRYHINLFKIHFKYLIYCIATNFTIILILLNLKTSTGLVDRGLGLDLCFAIVILLKGILVECCLLVICDVLLLLPTIRRIFRLEYSKNARYNARIIFGVFAYEVVVGAIIIMYNYVTEGCHNFSLWIQGNYQEFLTVFLIIGLCSLLFNGFIALCFQLQLEAKEQLQVSEAKYHSVFNNLNDIYCEATPEGIIRNISPSIISILGYTDRELIGTNIKKLYCNVSQRTEMLAILSEEREIKNYEIVIKDSAGFQHHFWVNGKIMLDFYGESKIVTMLRDVTQYIEAKAESKESAANLEAIFESTKDNIWLVDANYQLITGNKSFYNTAMKYTGKNINEIQAMKASISKIIFHGWKKYYEKAIQEGYCTIEQNYGTTYYEASFNPIYKDGIVTGVAVFSKEITARKDYEREVEKLNEELEHRVNHRTRELQEAIHEVESFTYTVSHDLRSPLRAIDAYTRILLEDYPEQVNNQISEMIGKIRTISKNMTDMINKLLQYSTTVGHIIFKEKINITEMIYQVYEEITASIPERNIKLIFETELPIIKADKLLMMRVINNALSNAIKFTSTRERAVISISHQIVEQEVIFAIKDNGVGFDMDLSSKLYQVFERLHSSDEFEGSGIGLATIRKIIGIHGGRTWIEGRLNEGATIHIVIPIIN